MNSASKNILKQLQAVLRSLSSEEFQHSLSLFSGASIGQHTRHILEFYQCIEQQKSSCINYDERKRDLELERNLQVTIVTIDDICLSLDNLTEDFPVTLRAQLNGVMHDVQSSLQRELLYALEHAVHHMAIIKMGILLEFPHISVPANFGVAESTVVYREQCAQ